MPDYRLYSVDPAGHILRVPVEFESASDEEALQTSEQYRDGVDLELWQQSRLVKKIPKLS